MRLAFTKYQGTGNDFIVTDVRFWRRPLDAPLAVKLCDRHRGIGADGILILDQDRLSMEVWNADGSRPEMCGNGLRCAARYFAEHGISTAHAFVITTDAGPHEVRVDGDRIQVQMRPPAFGAASVGFHDDGTSDDQREYLLSNDLSIYFVSMGNPHAVIFNAVDPAERQRLGPALEKDQRFKSGANIEFVEALDEHTFRVFVWERGAGWTQACGTGACAVVAAACEKNLAKYGTPMNIDLPGGRLAITYHKARSSMIMEGPAQKVFDGTVEINDLA